MSLIGKRIAEFKMEAYHDGEFKTFTDDSLLGKWSVLFFYPADFTFVCPTELEEMSELYDKFQEINCEIYSVSCDTHYVHKAWHDTSEKVGKITFPMLADPTGAFTKSLNVFIEESGMAERASFIVDPYGKIQAYEVVTGSVGRNATELFRKLQACQFVAQNGAFVCPAGWKPGGATLTPGIDLVGKL